MWEQEDKTDQQSEGIENEIEKAEKMKLKSLGDAEVNKWHGILSWR